MNGNFDVLCVVLTELRQKGTDPLNRWIFGELNLPNEVDRSIHNEAGQFLVILADLVLKHNESVFQFPETHLLFRKQADRIRRRYTEGR